jgi:hypothetical protein
MVVNGQDSEDTGTTMKTAQAESIYTDEDDKMFQVGTSSG